MYSALPNARRSDLAPQPSTGYDPTHWQTGLLASNFTTSSATSKRRRRHLREELESSLREEQLIADQQQLITARLEAHRRSDAIRRALREEENNAIALSSCSPRQPSSTASNSKQPQPRQQQPASASRTLDSASVHSNILPDSDTPVLKHNESTSTKLATQQRYVSPPPIIHLSSENHVQHPSTCPDSETTNRGYYAVDQAASSTKAATVKLHTAHATSSTKSTSSPSKPLSCEHTEQWPTNPMTVLLYAHAQPNLPSTNSSSVTNHRAQLVASPTPISTTSVTMTTPSEAQAPSPFYNSRPTRSSISQATTQLTHGLPAQNSTTMDRNNNAVCDTLQATGHKPRPRLIFDTRDWQLFTFTFSLSLSPVSSLLPPKVRFFRVGSVAETRHLSEPYLYMLSPLLSLSLFHLNLALASPKTTSM